MIFSTTQPKAPLSTTNTILAMETNRLIVLILLLKLLVSSTAGSWQRLAPDGRTIEPQQVQDSLWQNVTERQNGNGCRCVKEQIFSKTKAYGHASTGNPFDNSACLRHNEEVVKVVVRGRVEIARIEFHTTRTTYFFGSWSPWSSTLTLADGDTIDFAKICIGPGQRLAPERVYSIFIRTRLGHYIEQGTSIRCNYEYFNAPSGQAIVGAFGRSGGPIHQLGFITRPRLC